MKDMYEGVLVEFSERASFHNELGDCLDAGLSVWRKDAPVARACRNMISNYKRGLAKRVKK
jgi:hypothetical protein